ncbi:metal-dependent hydrolase [Hymenobacter sp. BT491]|uniref:metal-dependent hydrolase n=1 Tax=Hymenobacter sp. BT491 TaxID=2766779 RepID=UPI0016538961|nr:metal-dependent hydrolase [Hymenobacter sp. BT491]MBC6990402.1 metal-dependent hydrolase [Hymenobacter sp. BT491]
MKLTYYGHSCFLAEIGGAKVLFDPFIRPNALAKDVDVDKIEADFILLSHGHGDHVADAEEIGKRTGADLVGMFEVLGWFGPKGLKATYGMNIGGKTKLPFGTVKLVAALHSSSMPDGSYGGLAGGFVIEAEGKTFYFAGDTALTYDMKLIGEQYKLDFAILPIGDNFTMGIDDALIAADWIGTTKIVGMHYDTFPPIKIDHDEARTKATQAGKELVLMRIGETIDL